MMKPRLRTITLTGLLLTGLLLARTGSSKEVDREKFGPVAAAILKVDVVTTTDAMSVGTAVSIAPGKFVTSCHVTARASRVSLLYGGLRYNVARQLADTEHDVCVLDVPALNDITPVRVRSARSLRSGEEVAALGYTFGAGLLAQAGAIRSLHPIDRSVVIQSATPFSSGASGGGLFDAEGALVGVLTFRLPGVEGYYFSVPSDWLPAQLDDSTRYAAIGPLDGPAPFWARPRDLLPYFMQAAKLEAEGDWTGVLALTDRWAAAENGNAEAWLVRGQAYQHLDRDAESIQPLRVALQRDPALASAWFELGTSYVRSGDKTALREVLAALKPLDPQLAEDLAARGGVER